MTKYKDVEKKIDEALKLSKETGKEHSFNICSTTDGNISTTELTEGDKNFVGEKKCPETKLGSVHVHLESKEIPSPNDINNKT